MLPTVSRFLLRPAAQRRAGDLSLCRFEALQTFSREVKNKAGGGGGAAAVYTPDVIRATAHGGTTCWAGNASHSEPHTSQDLCV